MFESTQMHHWGILFGVIVHNRREFDGKPLLPSAPISIKMAARWPLWDTDMTKWTLSKHKTHVFNILKHSDASLRHYLCFFLSIIGESLRESPYYPHVNSIKMGAGWPLLDADKTKWTPSKHKTHVFDIWKHSYAPLRHSFWCYCPYSARV